MLLAHCLPDVEVVGVDTLRRKLTDVTLDAWSQCGRRLDNFRVVEADIADSFSLLQGHKRDAASLVVAVHACNEANLQVLDMARENSAYWAVMPCCMPKKLYIAGTTRLRKEQHYPLLCGMLAAQYNASMIKSIDPLITDKNLLVAGSFTGGDHHPS
eukprot:TRINITY_DN31099_c0_g2_i2.p1 TRINITY_DN31099_c0_g2~~TRINITY_DN31099_c0_g2_i2.p1  ORF type:complete len:157 (-),score=28.17 TRINITY_DN31099_c0_g2_i2:527-997(-)